MSIPRLATLVLAIAAAWIATPAKVAGASGAPGAVELSLGWAAPDANDPESPGGSVQSVAKDRDGIGFGAAVRFDLGHLRLRPSLRYHEVTRRLTIDDVDPRELEQRRQQLSLDVSFEVPLTPAGRAQFLLLAGPGVVHLRATDAEEFESIDGTFVSGHFGVAGEIAFGSRWHVRPDLRVRWTDGGDSDGDIEGFVAIGWSFGK